MGEHMGRRREVALVSGAGRGIGAGTARVLGRHGYEVIVNYLSDAAAARDVVKAIEAEGGTARALRADVCDEDEAGGLVERVAAEHGGIDVLVCNANTAPPTFEPLSALPWSAFEHKVVRELAGAFFLTRRAVAVMRERRAGRIVHVSSTAAAASAGSIAHSAAKAALEAFSRHAAADAGRFGISVNAVAPGFVLTEASAGVMPPGLREHLEERSVLGRLMEPEDVGQVIAQLVDRRAAATAGRLITIDGGMDVLAQRLAGLTPLSDGD
ncbi:SDR family oxidoreductase [Actinomadura roseirufa]|uniref:SDR family oxidoreductase n=1 Tax=Actinomadura roseirufa TaxID=2094049 RepID=UPI001A95560F|nr:SDR family oxidoreductase [Actinomadura roseirufa]